MPDNIYITASEIGEYVYCPRAWWLRKNTNPEVTPQMVRGSAAHDMLSFRLDAIGIRKMIILILILLILILLAVLIIVNLFFPQ